jgi:hypothetical protein
MAIPLKKSGVPASPLDGVTLILIQYQIILVFNSFQANAPLTAHVKGVHFLGENISLKMGSFAPFLATIEALSTTRALL